METLMTRTRETTLTLFLCLFTGQAALIVMSPVLTEVASDLHVSTAAAGQLRTITGLAAGTTALAMGAVGARISVRIQLLGASAAVGAASIASAAAPTFAVLALAQVPLGVGVGALTSAATLAAADWAPPEARTRTLSSALVGQPAAWIVGMPLVGALGGESWRYGWVALPLVAATAAGVLVARRPLQPPTARRSLRAHAVAADPALVRWLVSELLANAGWGGTLVYAGALIVERYGVSVGLAGLLLALGAAANVVGNLTCRRLVAAGEPGRVLARLASATGITVFLFGAVRLDVAAGAGLFAAAAFLAGGRTLATSAFALATPPQMRPTVTGLRAATMQFGYFAGSLVGGAALAGGGGRALGAAMGALFLAAAALARGTTVVASPRRWTFASSAPSRS
jgi:predicted MFS family arabinose efflux permease